MGLFGIRLNFEPRQPDETQMNAVKRLLARAGAKEVRFRAKKGTNQQVSTTFP